jgi:UPF0755 protein
MRRVLGAVLVLLIVLAVLAGGAIIFAKHVYDAPGPLPEAKNVIVPRGGLDTVAATLHGAGVIGNVDAFRVAATITRGDGALHSAELAFPAHASLRQVLAVLRTARPVEHRLTIPEGLTSAQIAELVAKTDGLTGETPVPPEGAVLPETYSFEYGTTRTALIERAERAMKRTLDKLWAGRSANLKLATPEQAVILASIVERETAKPDERPHVAAVFLNRLNSGMKLQSDPTVIYGVSGGMGELDRKLTRADLDHDDPYNTYRIDGLPPSPICSPGLASLKAVMNPASSDDLYFVADGTGGHTFSRTLDDHNRAVKTWRSLAH